MDSSDDSLLDQFPDELLLGLAHEAERDADRVAAFFMALEAQLGVPKGSFRKCAFSPYLLLELGAALRIAEWQEAGFGTTLTDLPTAGAAIRSVLIPPSPTAHEELPLLRQVIQLFTERFAWQSSSELGAPAVVAKFDEEELGRALARFIHAHRSVLSRSRHEQA